MGSEGENTVTSVERALDIVEHLKTLEKAGVTELAESVEMPESTVYNYLRTLEKREYIKKMGTSTNSPIGSSTSETSRE